LTGRENVYVNGTILGLSRAEIDRRFDEIVEFSEIGAFIDTPVKFYSSGMFVRLGFSVSVLADPDVLLVDEVLAVGDLAFQMKCFERMEDLRSKGTTIVIVTHNLNAVRRLCDRVLVVHDGEVRYDGDTVEGMSVYHDLLGTSVSTEDGMSGDSPEFVRAAEIQELELRGADMEPTRHVEVGSAATLTATIRFLEPVELPLLGMVVTNEAGIQVYGDHWPLNRPGGYAAGDEVKVQTSFSTHLATGSYSVNFGLATMEIPRIGSGAVPVLFFVTGRRVVRGIADLQGKLTTSDGSSDTSHSGSSG
jgi:ABC-2 type transport system ATP-binding protein